VILENDIVVAQKPMDCRSPFHYHTVSAPSFASIFIVLEEESIERTVLRPCRVDKSAWDLHTSLWKNIDLLTGYRQRWSNGKNFKCTHMGLFYNAIIYSTYS